MKRDNSSKYYYFDKNFYKSILNDLKYNATFFYSKLNEEIISMSIILFCNKKMHYHLSASKKEFQNLAPTNLLIYEAACWGFENGFDSLHLGGGLGCKEDGLYKFKKSFNKAEDKDFYIGRKIFNRELYNNLVKLSSKKREKGVKTSFFPAYKE